MKVCVCGWVCVRSCVCGRSCEMCGSRIGLKGEIPGLEAKYLQI